jgi:hypothetical protein
MTKAIIGKLEIEIEQEIINTKLNLQALANVLKAKGIITQEEFELEKKKKSDELKEKYDLE